MREVSAFGIEARRWTVVFHREAENWFFSAIAMGHFKHVSALAWIPELAQWWVYDVGFRRTRLRVLEDGQAAQTVIAAIMKGNAGVTVDVREDGLPWMRLGLFCTTAVSHLLGLPGWALRPDALYRKLVAAGGAVTDRSPPEPPDTWLQFFKDADPEEKCFLAAGGLVLLCAAGLVISIPFVLPF